MDNCTLHSPLKSPINHPCPLFNAIIQTQAAASWKAQHRFSSVQLTQSHVHWVMCRGLGGGRRCWGLHCRGHDVTARIRGACKST